MYVSSTLYLRYNTLKKYRGRSRCLFPTTKYSQRPANNQSQFRMVITIEVILEGNRNTGANRAEELYVIHLKRLPNV